VTVRRMANGGFGGTEAADILPYLQEVKPGGYAVHRVVLAKCQCGSTHFRLLLDEGDELAKTVCALCRNEAFVADAGEHWDGSLAEFFDCRCGASEFEAGLGLSIVDNEWVRWMSLGGRCVACGQLSAPIDWKSDLDLTEPDATRVG